MTSPATYGMTPRRLLFAKCFFGFMLIGSLVAMIARKELWPFSDFAMYASLSKLGTYSAYRLVGVTAEDPPRDHILTKGTELKPFTAMRLSGSLSQFLKKHESAAEREQVVSEMLQHYERRRQDGKHQGPRLQGMKLCKVNWELDASMEQVTPPVRMDVISQVTLEN